jgi:hypothetical protein
MAYTYTTFGSITLPTYNRESDLSPVAAMTRFVQTANGAFDADGSGRSLRRYPHPLTIDAIVSESTAALQRTAIDALRVAVGTRATLTRKADSDAAEHTATCRLVGMTQMRSYGERGYQPVRLQFAQLTPWRAKTATTYTVAVPQAESTTVAQVVANAGSLPVTAVTMTISTAWGDLQTPRWTATGHDVKLDYLFELAAPYAIVVNGGAMSAQFVPTSGTPDDLYSDLELGSGHTVDSWFRLEPGNTTITLSMDMAYEGLNLPEPTWTISFFAEYA